MHACVYGVTMSSVFPTAGHSQPSFLPGAFGAGAAVEKPFPNSLFPTHNCWYPWKVPLRKIQNMQENGCGYTKKDKEGKNR